MPLASAIGCSVQDLLALPDLGDAEAVVLRARRARPSNSSPRPTDPRQRRSHSARASAAARPDKRTPTLRPGPAITVAVLGLDPCHATPLVIV